jgi:tRNA (adenine22-N1)-methyltransferase
VEERFFMDEGKYYNIIKARSGSEHYDALVEYLFGKCLLRDKNPILKEYLSLKSDKLNHIAGQIECKEDLGERTQMRLHQIREELAQIAEALGYYESE